MKKQSIFQAIKFTLFSISAGVIQIAVFALLFSAFRLDEWLAHLIALVASVLWNFTLNRRYTFQSAANIPIAMLKVAAFYVVFTPLSTWFINWATAAGLQGYIAEGISMVVNFVTEFLFCKLVVYRGKENTRVDQKEK